MPIHEPHDDSSLVTDSLRTLFRREVPPVPTAALEVLAAAALGDTGQSRCSRYLLFLLAGMEEPTGFKGEGLLELRALDGKLSDAFLEILAWWRGPTRSDKPLYDVLERLHAKFSSSRRSI